MSSAPERSNWRPCTLVVQSSTTFDHGPRHPAGGVIVPPKFCAAPVASLDGNRSASDTVQAWVCGRDTGGAAVPGFCELISTLGVAAGAVEATVAVSSAAAASAIESRI